MPGEAAELYELPPAKFTAARNALAKRLRAEGKKEEAAKVAALRKPTATAWALNLLARREPAVVEAVLDAGRQLRQATEQTLRGDRSGFQAAQASERESIQEATGRAADLAEAAGDPISEAGRQRMAETLRAAIVDPQVADDLRRAVVQKDSSAAGLGLEGMSSDVIPKRREAEAPREAVEASRAELEEELRLARNRLDQAEAGVKEAEERAARLRNEVDSSRGEVERIAGRLADLDN